MAKNPIVTEEVEILIAEFHSRHPSWKAKDVQARVSQVLYNRNPKLPPGWPGLSTVQKVLTKIRKKESELSPDPEDRPWSMATLDDYPISPEAIPAVLEVWKSRIEQKQGFTIREAKWAARLSAIPRLKDITRLFSRASQYARLELIYQLIDRPFNSTIIDALLCYLTITPDLAGGADAFEALLPVLAGVREDAVDQIRDLKQGKIKGIYLGQHKQLPDPSLLSEIEIPGEKDIFKKSKGGTS